jgi:hypothetical protein
MDNVQQHNICINISSIQIYIHIDIHRKVKRVKIEHYIVGCDPIEFGSVLPKSGSSCYLIFACCLLGLLFVRP